MAQRGGRKKGTPKTGGRTKGTPNKVNRGRRELIAKFLDDNWDEFLDLYKNSTAAKKQEIYMEMLPYTTPKLAAVEYKEAEPAKTFADELDELSEEPTRQ